MNPSISVLPGIMASWLAGTPPQDPGWLAENWQVFKTAARVHGVGPLLSRKLKGVPWVPVEINAWLNEQYRHNQTRITHLHSDLRLILAACSAGNFPVMPLKGSLLTAQYYPDPALRPMADLDLLVRPSDRNRAEKVLNSLGYRQLSANWKHQEWALPGNQEVVSKDFEHPDNPRKVDLHTSVEEMLGGPRLDITAELWRRAEYGRVCGQPAWLPHHESLWLHLVVHSNANIWGLNNRLLHLFDLTLLPTPSALPVPDTRFVHLALHLLFQVFPSPERAALLSASAQRLSSEFLSWAQGFDLHGSSFLGRPEAPPYLERLRSFYRGNPGDFLAALQFLLLPNHDEVLFELGQKGSFPHLPLTWSKLLFQKLTMVVRLLRA